MLQKTYQYGAIVRIRQKKIRRIVWKKNWIIEDLRYASLFQLKKENGKWYPKFVKMLLGNEGSLSIKHLKTWLQS